jgi:putative endonuclease
MFGSGGLRPRQKLYHNLDQPAGYLPLLGEYFADKPRAVAQLGSALEWGSRGRGFESRRPDDSRDIMYYVDVLSSSSKNIRYVGSCENPDERLRRHNAGHSKATRHGIPWVLVHSEPLKFQRRAEAVRRERYFKSGIGRDELDRLAL